MIFALGTWSHAQGTKLFDKVLLLLYREPDDILGRTDLGPTSELGQK